MISTLKKKLNKKGFTLAELLIVVAIIAILVAIAIPVFSSQLENTRKAVDDANARSIRSMAVAEAMTSGGAGDYYGVMSNTGELSISTSNPSTGYNQATQGSESSSLKKGAAVYKVVVDADYKITSEDWVAKGTGTT